MATRTRNILFAVAFGLACLGAVRVDGLRPTQGKSIELGEISGIATALSSVVGFTSSLLLRRAR
jgi:hypothetical protein